MSQQRRNQIDYHERKRLEATSKLAAERESDARQARLSAGSGAADAEHPGNFMLYNAMRVNSGGNHVRLFTVPCRSAGGAWS